ncbi:MULTISPECIES: acyl-CoA carboxylase subunit epsilon [Subtercola]|uniref:Acyl-CoA carboxylase subunit epsilon n=1 Tax=Subtercola vilae TaxID=2056433 RepID=A0A4T2C276_9MICO|nr:MULTISPECIES: acyl-CoA carboxylase subunit epsilon [Subtercola]MEA9984441.1 acyl-CoA carboxylase subunit epsilon [Subtercola sp. RTI3]TIH37789.1 acyl-CoA carboxylase subunit epsilon [Subtercola vilae]
MTDSPDDGTVDAPVIVTTKNVTHAELAAVTAVVRGMLEEEGDSLRSARAAAPTAWQRSQRELRQTLTPGSGRWNG